MKHQHAILTQPLTCDVCRSRLLRRAKVHLWLSRRALRRDDEPAARSHAMAAGRLVVLVMTPPRDFE